MILKAFLTEATVLILASSFFSRTFCAASKIEDSVSPSTALQSTGGTSSISKNDPLLSSSVSSRKLSSCKFLLFHFFHLVIPRIVFLPNPIPPPVCGSSGNCYDLIKDSSNVDWDYAYNYCNGQGGNLAVFTNPQEQQLFNQKIDEEGCYLSWVNARQPSQGDSWQYKSSDTTFTEIPSFQPNYNWYGGDDVWVSGEPNDYNGVFEGCANMNSINGEDLNDSQCNFAGMNCFFCSNDDVLSTLTTPYVEDQSDCKFASSSVTFYLVTFRLY